MKINFLKKNAIFYIPSLIKTLLTGLLILLPLLPLFPQSTDIPFLSSDLSAREELQFQHYSSKDGLSELINFSVNIIQDRAGFLWIPSLNGLNRFDGREFRVYQYQRNKNTGPSNNTIYNIQEDSNGKLWVGVRMGSMNIFDPETGIFEQAPNNLSPLAKSCLSTSRNAFKDSRGNMWISAPKGPCFCEKGTWNFKKYYYNIAGGPFLEQTNGTIWGGTPKGLFRFHPELDSFIFHEPYPEERGKTVFNKVEAIEESNQGEIWISSKRKGQKIFNPQTEQFRELPASLIKQKGSAFTSFFRDKNDNMWLGNNQFIAKWNEKNKEASFSHHDPKDLNSCPKGSIVSIFQDKAGSLWFISFYRGGLSVIHSTENPFQILPPLNYLQVFALNERQMLLATNKGLLVFDIYKEQIVPNVLPPLLQKVQMDWIRMSSKKELWYRENKSKYLFRYNFETGEFKRYNKISKFVMDSKDNIWTAGANLWKFDTENELSTKMRSKMEAADSSGIVKKTPTFNTMDVDSKGRVWIGTIRKGLIMYDPDLDSIRIFQHQPDNFNTPPNGNISFVFAGKKGRIYIHADTGLGIYDSEKDTFLIVNRADGLVKHMASPMLEDRNNQVWYGNLQGLTQLNLADLNLKNFDENDGLPFGLLKHGVSAQDARGFLYFLKKGKLIRFHPDSVRLNDYIAPIVMTDFYLNHQRIIVGERDSLLKKEIHYQRNIVLNHKQTDFGIRFVSPTFYKSKQIKYFYQLENYNEDWVAIGNQLEAHFTNIPAGKYQFKVKAQSVADSWTETNFPINITILPPWWETSLAYSLYLFLTITIVYSIYRYQLRKQMAESEAIRLKDLNTQKTKLYTNITHEFRTPLTVIQGMSDQIKGNEEARSLIRRNSKNLLHLITQLLDMSKLESAKMQVHLIQRNIVSYLRYLTQSFESYAETKQIKLTYYSEIDELIMDYDPEKIQHIIANLLSNAIKFTQETGEIIVHISCSALQTNGSRSEVLRIKIQDNGMGIKEEHLPHLFNRFYQIDDTTTRRGEGTGIGLALAKELVELMDGTISVESIFGQGTEFKVLMPVRRSKGLKQINEDSSFDILPVVQATSLKSKTPIELNETLPNDRPSLPLLLLIEDNHDVSVYIKNCLQDQYNMFFATDGKQGIEKAIEIIPDIIISDVMMPEKDGFEVCATLKNDERTSHIPIILLTAKADVASKIEGLERGADAYLAKPFDKKELLVRLEKLIELRRKLQSRYLDRTMPLPSLDKGLQIEDAFLQKVRDIMNQNLDDAQFDVPQLSKKMGMSRSQLYRKIKALTDQSIVAYIRSIRLQKGLELLQTSDLTVSDVAYEVGFTDPAYFSRAFSKEFGKSPMDIKK